MAALPLTLVPKAPPPKPLCSQTAAETCREIIGPVSQQAKTGLEATHPQALGCSWRDQRQVQSSEPRGQRTCFQDTQSIVAELK